MARLLIILAVLAVFVLAISNGQQSRPELAGDLETAEGSLRTKRSRADSRYSPGSAGVNPNRGRKRVRLTDGRPEAEVRTERPVEQAAFTAPRNINRGEPRFQEAQPTSPPRNLSRGQIRFQEPQTTSRPRNLNRGGSRRPLTRARPAVRNFETTTERRVSNRLATRPPQTRSRNIKNNRNVNRFYEETSVKRNELFFDSKSKYCRPGSNDYYDYDDYDRTDIQSSQDQAPLTIEVTHQLPLATQRNNFLIPNIISSIEVLAVSGLKSTDVDNLPVIYANAYTLTKQPGYKEILFDALRATETLQVTFAPTCLNGRQTSYSQLSTSTIYSVETITEKVYEEVIPTQNLNDLLLKLLPDTKKPDPILFAPASQLIINTAPLTTFIIHTSSYVTKITESESTELSLTFRGKPVVTTIIETSVKEITATEFSTETIVTSQLVTQTRPAPQILPTSLPSLDQADGDIEKQLLLAELNKLLSKQSIPTPPIVQELDKSNAVELATQSHEITHTSTYVTTLTEENSQVIPLTFRGKVVETTLYNTATKVITATEYSTDIVTQVATQTPQAQNILPTKISPPQNDDFGLINLLPELVEQLLGNPQMGNLNPLDDALLEQQIIEALAGNFNVNEIKEAIAVPNTIPVTTQAPAVPDTITVTTHFPAIPNTIPVITESPISPEPLAQQFSVTTIFKSGRSPGDFTRIISTIYFDENRKKREAGINPSKSTIRDKTVIALIEPDGAEAEETIFNSNLIQSGKYF